jgi:hypothetical protein
MEIQENNLYDFTLNKSAWKGLSTLNSFQIRIVGGGVQTGSTRHVGHFWPIVTVPGDCEDGEFGGKKIGRGNRNTWRKPAPLPLCP